MLRGAIETGIKFRLLVMMLAAGVLAIGVFQLRDTRIDALPEFSPPYVEVQTEALGLSAAEVEQLITVPLEADLLNGVAFLDEIKSNSLPGLSSVVMIFEPGTDLYRARQLVAERMTQAHALPNVSKPPVMQEPVSSSSRALVMGLSSPTLSLIDQSVLTRWTIRPRLMGVPGVSNVSVYGERDRQLQVQVDPAVLNANGLALLDVIRTAGNATWVSPLTFLEASTPGTGGFIDTPNQRMSVQNISPIVSADTLAQVAVENHPGVRLGDVARVVEDHQLLIGDGIVDDASGLLLIVEKFPEANTLEVTRGVEAALQELAPGLGDLRVDSTVYRPATFVESAMSNVSLTMFIGLALVILLVGLAFYSWRAAVIAGVVIPLAVSTAVVVLDLFGVTMNMIVVLGLAGVLVVVVDDAVRDPEAIARRARAAPRASANGSRLETIVGGVLPMRRSAMYASLIVGVAVTPAFFVPGSAGAFVTPLAVAYLVGLASAMLIALLVIPALVSLLVAGPAAHRRDAMASRVMQRAYDRFGSRAVPSARTAVVGGAVLVIVGALMLPLLSTSLMPRLREPDLLVTFDGSHGLAQGAMTRITASASAELRAVPGVNTVGARVGRALQSEEITDVNSAEIWVSIDESVDYDATVAAVQQIVDGYPGLSRAVHAYLDDRGGVALSGPGSDFAVRVYGENSEVLSAKATEVQQLLSGVDGLMNVAVQQVPLKPTLQVEVDLIKAQQFNVRPGDVRRTVATLLAGLGVGSLFENQKVFEVVVWGTPEIRSSVTGVQNLLVDRPDGGQVRVGDVAQVRVAPAPAVIQRDASSRFVDVTATIDDRSYAAIADDVRDRLRNVEFPFEHRAEIVGDSAQSEAALTRIIGVCIVALILAYLLLQAALRSWAMSLIVLASLPAGLAGGLVATVIGGGVVSLGTVIGLLGLATISIKQSLTLNEHLQEVRAAEPLVGRVELIRRATRDHLAPIVITGLGGAVLLLPIVIAGPIAGLELLHPMSLAVLGGLVTTTLLNLLVLPGLYAGRTWHRHLDMPTAVGHRTDHELVTDGSMA